MKNERGERRRRRTIPFQLKKGEGGGENIHLSSLHGPRNYKRRKEGENGLLMD